MATFFRWRELAAIRLRVCDGVQGASRAGGRGTGPRCARAGRGRRPLAEHAALEFAPRTSGADPRPASSKRHRLSQEVERQKRLHGLFTPGARRRVRIDNGGSNDLRLLRRPPSTTTTPATRGARPWDPSTSRDTPTVSGSFSVPETRFFRRRENAAVARSFWPDRRVWSWRRARGPLERRK